MLLARCAFWVVCKGQAQVLHSGAGKRFHSPQALILYGSWLKCFSSQRPAVILPDRPQCPSHEASAAVIAHVSTWLGPPAQQEILKSDSKLWGPCLAQASLASSHLHNEVPMSLCVPERLLLANECLTFLRDREQLAQVRSVQAGRRPPEP